MTRRFDGLVGLLHHGANPYSGFLREQWPAEPFAAWDSRAKWFHEEIDQLRPSTVIEVGTFLGGSAIWMASRLRELGLDAALICVDSWPLNGLAPWFTDNSSPEYREFQARLARPYDKAPDVYKLFLANVLEAGLQGYIVPLRMLSARAAPFLRKRRIFSPLIYIDACHEEADVYRDLCRFWGLLVPGGAMIVDDARQDWAPGVQRALERFACKRGLAIEYYGGKARMRKRQYDQAI